MKSTSELPELNNKSPKLDFDTFLSEVAALCGNKFSSYVFKFCNNIKSASDREQQLESYFEKSELGFISISSIFLKYTHPDKHASSELSDHQKSIISEVTLLIYALRNRSKKLTELQKQADYDDVVEASRSCDIFTKDLSDYECIKKMEEVCFVRLYNDFETLPRAYLDALLQHYHNLYVYITYWCKERNAVWLNDNLQYFRSHVISIKNCYKDQPDLQNVFEDFLKIGHTMTISDMKLLEGAEQTNQKITNAVDPIPTTVVPAFSIGPVAGEGPVSMSSNALGHVRTVAVAALSIGLVAAAGPVSWSAFIAFSIFRTFAAVTEMAANEMIDRSYTWRVEHYLGMLNTMKNDHEKIINSIIARKEYELRQHEDSKWVQREHLKLLSVLIEEYSALKTQPDEKLLMNEIGEHIKEMQATVQLSLFSHAKQPVTLPLCDTGYDSDFDELSFGSSEDSSSEIEIPENIRTFTLT